MQLPRRHITRHMYCMEEAREEEEEEEAVKQEEAEALASSSSDFSLVVTMLGMLTT